jgi:hypothetical protein
MECCCRVALLGLVIWWYGAVVAAVRKLFHAPELKVADFCLAPPLAPSPGKHHRS